jgi:hypothetical protein
VLPVGANELGCALRPRLCCAVLLLTGMAGGESAVVVVLSGAFHFYSHVGGYQVSGGTVPILLVDLWKSLLASYWESSELIPTGILKSPLPTSLETGNRGGTVGRGRQWKDHRVLAAALVCHWLVLVAAGRRWCCQPE